MTDRVREEEERERDKHAERETEIYCRQGYTYTVPPAP